MSDEICRRNLTLVTNYCEYCSRTHCKYSRLIQKCLQWVSVSLKQRKNLTSKYCGCERISTAFVNWTVTESKLMQPFTVPELLMFNELLSIVKHNFIRILFHRRGSKNIAVQV